MPMRIKLREVALKKKGWSLYRLSDKMGISEKTVYSWEKNGLPSKWIMPICEILECYPNDIFDLSELL